MAKAVRDVEMAVKHGRVRPATRTTFQAVAMLVREERARVQAAEISEGRRAEHLKRIGDVVVKEDRPEIRGMVIAVAHLVSVEEVD